LFLDGRNDAKASFTSSLSLLRPCISAITLRFLVATAFSVLEAVGLSRERLVDFIVCQPDFLFVTTHDLSLLAILGVAPDLAPT